MVISLRLIVSEIDYIVRDCDVKVFIILEVKKDVVDELKGLFFVEVKCYVVIGFFEGYESWEMIIVGFLEMLIVDESLGIDMFYLLGIMGCFKGVCIFLFEGEFNDEFFLLMFLKVFYNFDENSIYFLLVLFYYVVFLCYNMMVNIMGVMNVIMEKFDLEEYLKFVEKYKIINI